MPSNKDIFCCGTIKPPQKKFGASRTPSWYTELQYGPKSKIWEKISKSTQHTTKIVDNNLDSSNKIAFNKIQKNSIPQKLKIVCQNNTFGDS